MFAGNEANDGHFRPVPRPVRCQYIIFQRARSSSGDGNLRESAKANTDVAEVAAQGDREIGCGDGEQRGVIEIQSSRFGYVRVGGVDLHWGAIPGSAVINGAFVWSETRVIDESAFESELAEDRSGRVDRGAIDRGERDDSKQQRGGQCP